MKRILLLVSHPGINDAKNRGWKGDEEVKKKTDRDGDKNQGEFDTIKYQVFPASFNVCNAIFFVGNPFGYHAHW